MDVEQNEIEQLKNENASYKKMIELQHKEISMLRKSNEMYQGFLKLNNRMNYLSLMIALIAFILGVSVFLSAVK